MHNETCLIISNEKISKHLYKLVFRSEKIAKKSIPGQFLHIKVNQSSLDPLLRRPISINDIQGDCVTIIYKLIGKGTEILKNKLAGENIDILGPLGNGFEIESVDNCILVGGGIGIAPLTLLAKKLNIANKNVKVFLGSDTKENLFDIETFDENAEDIYVATDDGSLGEKGFVTQVLEKYLSSKDLEKGNTVVYACGPDVMLKELGRVCEKYGIEKVYISMENWMGCGVGVCLGCVIDTVNGKKRVCKDGPVFEYKDILWKKETILDIKNKKQKIETIDTGVYIGDLYFRNPVITASGTFGYGVEYEDIIDVSKIGGITVKGVSLSAWEGNTNYRLVETPSGLINAIGLQNLGVKDFIENKLPIIRELDTNIIVNISEHTIDGYAKLAEELTKAKGVDALEVNISCPNVSKGGITFGTDAEEAGKVISAVRGATGLPIIAKLTPNVTDITEIALACEQAGADALSLINTILAMVIDTEKKKPVLGNIKGGLSGPAIRPVAVRMVWEVFEKCNIPIIGMGGIMNANDAIEFILAGACLTACGTGTFVNPELCLDVVSGIENYMKKNGFENIDAFKGLAHK